MSQNTSVAILGTGMAGCGAIHRLAGEGLEPIVFDKAAYFGGHTASFAHEGCYVFDEGGPRLLHEERAAERALRA